MLRPTFTTGGSKEMIGSMTPAGQRIAKRDVAITAVLSLLGLLLMYGNVVDHDENMLNPDTRAVIHVGNLVPYVLVIPLFLLVTVPLLWRRVAPIPAVGASFAGLVVNDLLTGTEVLRCGVVLPTALLFAFTAAAQLERRDAARGLALALGLVVLDFSVGFGAATTAVMAGVTAAIWGVGRIVHSRRRMAEELGARTEELRDARDERARLEVASERARISRDLDELLQRRLGELAHMADAGASPGGAASATATLVDIERESRRTLEEMRAVVGVLRDDSSEVSTSPQPTLTHLEALLVRAKGQGARLTVEGSPRVLPASVELSAYRVVEHLLAALEDTPDVDVRVRFGDDALELAVSGPARRRADAAIERARERVRMQRGTLDATLQGGRADAVASLPFASAA
jgi:signal transduction histidine kinase